VVPRRRYSGLGGDQFKAVRPNGIMLLIQTGQKKAGLEIILNVPFGALAKLKIECVALFHLLCTLRFSSNTNTREHTAAKM